MDIAAQVSIYPLRQSHLTLAIGKATETFKKYGLSVEVGAMSTVLSGNDEALFGALKEVFASLADKGELVMMVTFSNTCPVGK